MEFICYEKCTTCRRAKKWLDDNGFSYALRDIKSQNPTETELRKWHALSGLPLKRFFNTSGQLYKELGLAAKLAGMNDEEQLELLSGDGMLVKRPIVVGDDFVVVGFDENEWALKLSGSRVKNKV